MAHVVREYWVNVYRRKDPQEVYTGGNTFASKEAGEMEGKLWDNYLDTVLLYKEEV